MLKKEGIIFLICGSDNKLHASQEKELLQKIFLDPIEIASSVQSFHMDEADLGDVVSEMASTSLISAKRLFKLYQCHILKKADWERLIPYNTEEVQLLIITTEESKKLPKVLLNHISEHGKIFESKKLYDNQLQKFIQSQLQRSGFSFDQALPEYLSQRMESNESEFLELLSLLKITYANHIKTETVLTIDDVAPLLSGAKDEIMYSFQDSLAKEEPTEALSMLSTMLENNFPMMKIFFGVQRYVINLLNIQILQSKKKAPETIAKELGIHPFVVRKLSPTARQLGMSQFEAILLRLFQLDYYFKSREPRLHRNFMEIFIIDFFNVKSFQHTPSRKFQLSEPMDLKYEAKVKA